MGDSSIQWTDKTWNPTVGCDKVSSGCQACYAIRTAYRLAVIGQEPYQGLTRKLPDGSVNWTGVVRTLPEAYAAANQMQERAFYDLSRMDKAQAAQPEGEPR